MPIVVMEFVYFLQQGNRSSSSACGSADVLETLGVNIELEPEVSTVYIANVLFIGTRLSQFDI